MIGSRGGAPADVKPDPRYLIPYDKPIPTAYPAAVVSPGGPDITPQPIAKARPPQKPATSKNERKRPDPTKRFERNDRNKDGFLTLEEYIGNPEGRNVPALTKQFSRRDGNADGKLTLPELKN